jgi:hypothetical protein
VTRRDFLGWAMGVGALAMAPALREPDEPMGLLGLIDDGMYGNTYVVARPEAYAFEWDDTPLDVAPFDPDTDAFEVVMHLTDVRVTYDEHLSRGTWVAW